MAGATVERICACGCQKKFTARVADVNRGWGKFATKSCKATDQERRTGQNRAYVERQIEREESGGLDDCDGHIFASGYFGHGQN